MCVYYQALSNDDIYEAILPIELPYMQLQPVMHQTTRYRGAHNMHVSLVITLIISR